MISGDNMLENISLQLFHNAQLLPILLCIFIFSIALLPLLFLLKKKNIISYDWFAITLILIPSSIIGFWQLGSFDFPQTYWQPISDQESIVFKLNETTRFDKVVWLSAEGDNLANPNALQYGSEFIISGSQDAQSWSSFLTLDTTSYAQWQFNDTPLSNYRYIQITSTNINNVLHEIAFIDADGNALSIQLISVSNNANTYDAQHLIDEQDIIPEYYHYTTSSYFDEVYHVRNAYEIANQQPMYASVHPLLGTSLIAMFTKFFGFNAFGWRVGGVIFSLLMLPLFYFTAKTLFQSKRYATIATLLFSVDFMRYTTSRIGTLEPFSLFFIIAMSYFMFKYIRNNQVEHFKKGLLYLALSGIFFGLGMATKWTAAYGAVALAIILFTNLYHQYRTQYHKHFIRHLIQTLAWCVIFFVAVPAIVYVFSFAHTIINRNESFSLIQVIEHSIQMYDYHAHLDSTHPFQSTWIEWIFNIQPIWYYISYQEASLSTITAFVNPIIAWGGVIALIHSIFSFFKHPSQTNSIVLCCFLCAIVPWILIERCVFIYHYYPAIPFLILAITGMFARLEQTGKITKKITYGYLITCIVVFILFLPVISGFETTSYYINHILRWLPSWYFGA